MTYLLTLGWPWFTGALAIGALVGFLSFSRARDATFSGGWVAALGALTLAAGFIASVAGLFSGRAALTLDIALLAGFAYAAGLPAGGFLKAVGGAAFDRPPPAVAPVIVAPPRRVEAAAAPSTDRVAQEAAPPASPAVGKKSPPGARPETLASPRNGVADDLSRIKGIGPKSREKLNALGVFHYDQIAAWNLDNAKWIGVAIGAPGRIERDKWIQQSRALVGSGTDQ